MWCAPNSGAAREAGTEVLTREEGTRGIEREHERSAAAAANSSHAKRSAGKPQPSALLSYRIRPADRPCCNDPSNAPEFTVP